MTKKTGNKVFFFGGGDWKGNWGIPFRVSKTAIFKKYVTFSKNLSDFGVNFERKACYPSCLGCHFGMKEILVYGVFWKTVVTHAYSLIFVSSTPPPASFYMQTLSPHFLQVAVWQSVIIFGQSQSQIESSITNGVRSTKRDEKLRAKENLQALQLNHNYKHSKFFPLPAGLLSLKSYQPKEKVTCCQPARVTMYSFAAIAKPLRMNL